MTPQAFNERNRSASDNAMLLDQITWANKRELLLYRGGEDGEYMILRKDGTTEKGTYTGAYPSIGDALFHPGPSIKPSGYLMVMYETIAKELD